MALALEAAGNYYPTRRNGPVILAVQHITAGLSDYIAPDLSADNTMNWGRNPASDVSWHDIVDSDTSMPCLPSSFTAWHAKGYNSRSIGQELGTGGTNWDAKPADWKRAALLNSAERWAPHVIEHGLPLVKVTKAQVDAVYNDPTWTRPLGFIGHGDLDPRNRTDPGLYAGRDTFPWDTLFGYIRDEVARITGTVGGKLDDHDKPGIVTAASFNGVLGPRTIRAWQTYYARAGRLPVSAVDDVISEPSMLIREVQKDLARLHLYAGAVDGYAGPQTWTALGKRFGTTGRKPTIQALQFDLWKRGLIS